MVSKIFRFDIQRTIRRDGALVLYEAQDPATASVVWLYEWSLPGDGLLRASEALAEMTAEAGACEIFTDPSHAYLAGPQEKAAGALKALQEKGLFSRTSPSPPLEPLQPASGQSASPKTSSTSLVTRTPAPREAGAAQQVQSPVLPPGQATGMPVWRKLLWVALPVVLLAAGIWLWQSGASSRRFDADLQKDNLVSPASENAFDLYNQALRKEGPNSPRVREMNAKLLARLQSLSNQLFSRWHEKLDLTPADWEDLQKIQESILALAPSDPVTLQRKAYVDAELLYLQQHYAEAAQGFQETLRKNPGWSLAGLSAGDSCMALRRWTCAEEYFIRAKTAEPDWGWPERRLADLRHLRGLEEIGTANPPVVPAPPAIVNFHADPASISKGGNATLRWLVTGATSLQIQPGLTGLPAQGSVQISPATTTQYILIAEGAEGAKSTSTVTVAVAEPAPRPVVSFEAEPISIVQGQSATIRWSVTGASQLSIDPGMSSAGSSGSLVVKPQHTTRYILTADGPGGVTTSQISITVIAPSAPVISFDAEPKSIVQGKAATLHWSVAGASRVSIAPDIGVVGDSGSAPIRPGHTTNYTLTAEGASTTEKRNLTVTVSPPRATSGEILWTGFVNGIQLVTINGDSADKGKLEGALPGLPCIIQLADEKHVAIASAPSPRNNYERMVVRVQGKGLMKVTIKWSLQ